MRVLIVLFLLSSFSSFGQPYAEKAKLEQIKNAKEHINFLVIGDWGREGLNNQTDVGNQLARNSISDNSAFIISTGDNFYTKGVKDTEDPLFKKSFEEVYTAPSLQKDWYVALGNHDYKTNPDAEVAYSGKSKRWHMPSRYYSFKMPISNRDTTNKILFVCIDTSPLMDGYYSDEYADKLVEWTLPSRWPG